MPIQLLCCPLLLLRSRGDRRRAQTSGHASNKKTGGALVDLIEGATNHLPENLGTQRLSTFFLHPGRPAHKTSAPQGSIIVKRSLTNQEQCVSGEMLNGAPSSAGLNRFFRY